MIIPALKNNRTAASWAELVYPDLPAAEFFAIDSSALE